jgi:hypothetical protein
MRYKLKKDLLWLKEGEIKETLEDGKICFINTTKEDRIEVIRVCPKNFPDWFEPIDEKQEELEQKIKDIEAAGYTVEKKYEVTGNRKIDGFTQHPACLCVCHPIAGGPFQPSRSNWCGHCYSTRFGEKTDVKETPAEMAEGLW